LGWKAAKRREWTRSVRRRHTSEVEASEEVRRGVMQEGREAMTTETASGEGGRVLGPRRLRRNW
jgi:hypothetical protein